MVKRYGFDRYGRQRFYCLNPDCGRTFQWFNLAVKHSQESSWFKQWVKEGYSVRQLTGFSGHSERKINSLIRGCLKKAVPASTLMGQYLYLLCDGTFIEGRKCALFVIMDASKYSVVAGEYGLKEKSKELQRFFQKLKVQGLNPKSFTTDGNFPTLKAIQAVWPDVIIQRCLVHIQRQGLMWCRARPKRIEAQELRKLFLRAPTIDTREDAETFIRCFLSWDRKYGQRLLIGKQTGWITSDLIRARSMLINALPDMFYFLSDPSIPKTTNGLEGYFSRLKDKYYRHRGLGAARRMDYFKWYLHIVKR